MMASYLKQDEGTRIRLEMGTEENGRHPFVSADGKRYSSMNDLAAAHPALCDPAQLPLCCRICLHFVRSVGFILIENPDEFRRRYGALVRHGGADFGPFDTSEISHPQLANDKLVFYVENKLYGVPYRVEAPFPDHAQGVVKFLLLPPQE